MKIQKITASCLILAIFTLLVTSSCEKDESSSNFSDKLTLGTGAIGFDLTEEGTTFTLTGSSVILYFRLESEADMAGRTVILDFMTSGNGLINTITRQQAQSYGHIMVSNFEWLGGRGTFKINAYLGEKKVDNLVATIDFTIN
jgi:hypothetical protein